MHKSTTDVHRGQIPEPQNCRPNSPARRRGERPISQDLFYAPNRTTLQTNLDAVWMSRGSGQDISDRAFCTFPGSLVSLEYDANPQSWLDVFALGAVHIPFPLSQVGSRRPPRRCSADCHPHRFVHAVVHHPGWDRCRTTVRPSTLTQRGPAMRP